MARGSFGSPIDCRPALQLRTRRDRPHRPPSLHRHRHPHAFFLFLSIIFVAVSAAAEHSTVMAVSTATSSQTADADTSVLNTSNDTASLIATSDVTALFYNHYNSGVIVAPLVLPNGTYLPDAIVERLKPLNLSFDQLDGFLQRAILWDAGYIYSPSPSFTSNTVRSGSTSGTALNPFLKIYTRNGVAMSAIAPSRSQMERAGCSVQTCASENFGSTLRAVSCQKQSEVFSIVQCAIDVGASGGGAALSAVAPDGRQRAVWTAWNAEDRSASTLQEINKTELAAPDLNVGQYMWSPDQESRSDNNNNNKNPDAGSSSSSTVRLLAIHTVTFSDEPPVGQCPSSRTDSRGDLLPSLTIPCAPYNAVVSPGSRRQLTGLASGEWVTPQESKLLASWLQSVAPKSVAKAPVPGSGNVNAPPKPTTPISGQNRPINSGPRPPASDENRSDRTTQTPSGAGRGGGFNLLNLIPILVGAVALIAVAIGFVLVRRRNNAKQRGAGRGMDYGPYSHNPLRKTDDVYFDGSAFLSPAPGIGFGATASPTSRSRQLDFENELYSSNEDSSIIKSVKSYDPEVTRSSSDRRRKLSKSTTATMTNLRRVISDPSGGGGSTTVSRPSLDTEHLKLLQTDPNLSASRISYDKIVFERVLSRSARYEVWLCQYEGEELAVKRLVQRPSPSLVELDEELSLRSGGTSIVALSQSDDINTNMVEAFVAEIQITAALEHPNLARFVGVAWARLPVDSLCLLMEYQSNGDLRSYVSMHTEKLSAWNRLKIKWSRGIASGLRYLHNQRPVVLHLELNSTHILLSDRLQPKLIDFGERLSAEDWTQLRISGEMPLAMQSSSLQQQQRHFPYWAAPEVLRGEGHLMASDVYSFGMLLVELDACAIPFQDARNTSNGKKLKPFQMMNMVISGRLIPTVTSSCPDELRDIVERCTDLVPGRRPKMPEVVRMLERVEANLLL